MAKQYSKSFLTAAKSMRAAMLILKDNGGSMPSRQLMDAVEKQYNLVIGKKKLLQKVVFAGKMYITLPRWIM